MNKFGMIPVIEQFSVWCKRCRICAKSVNRWKITSVTVGICVIYILLCPTLKCRV